MEFTTPLQNSVEAEKSVLGSMLVDKIAVTEAVEELVAEDFFSRVHQEIFAAMLALNVAGRPVDLVTVIAELERRGTFEGVGGYMYLTEINTFTPTTANVKAYIAIVREKSLLRRLAAVAADIQKEATEGTYPAPDILNRAEKRIFDISMNRETTLAGDFNEVLVEAYRHIGHLFALKGAVDGVPSGYTALDEMLTGFHGGELILLAARPAMGKTSFLLNLAQHAAFIEKKHVAFFSLEMPRIQLAVRLLCSITHTDMQQVRKGQLTPKEWEALGNALQTLANTPLYLDDVSSLTVNQMRSKLRRLKMERGVDMVVIDYLQLMSGSRRMESRQIEVSEISRNLKSLSKELDIPIIAGAQLSRVAAQRAGTTGGHRPVMSDLRESGAMEQDADVIMLLHRESYYNNEADPTEAEVIVAKQRNGPVGTVDMTWNAQYQLFTNRAQRFAPESTR